MAGYTRQSSFADGDTITAALFNNEYNQLVNAFHNSTGHTHDGTAASGPVIGLIGDAGETSPNNKVLIDTTNNHIEFYVEVSSSSVQQLYIADGAIVPVTDNDIDLGTSSLEFKDAFFDGTVTTDALVADTADINGGTVDGATIGANSASTGAFTTVTTTGNVDVGGNLTVTGTTTFNGGTLTLGDADTDNIVFGGEVDSNIIPDDDNTYDLGSSSKEWKDLYVDGVAYVDAINFNGTAITSTAAELNILDGVTSTASELNILDGVTATTAELNIMDGVTATTAELNIMDGVTATTAELNIMDGVTSTTAELNILDGVTSTTSELNILDGVTSTATELNLLDGVTATTTELNYVDVSTVGTVEASKAIVVDGNKDFTGVRNITITGELDAATLDISGDVDIDGTLEADAITVNGTTLAETISDTVGAMVTSNTETGITVSYDDSDNTLDFVIGTLNQDTTGNAATATALETARTIHGVSFDGTANIDLSEVIQDTVGAMVSSNTESGITVTYEDSDGTLDFTVGTLNQSTTGNAATATALETARTIHGVSFDGTANIDLTEVVQDTVGAMFSSNTESGITVDYQDSDGTIDLTVGTLNQNTTGSAATLTTARTIGGVSFDGSANIVPTTFNAATFSGDVNVDSGVLFVDVSENKIGVNETSPTVSVDLGSNTDAILLPKGTTAQRPTAEAGQFRYNTTTGEFEGYTDAWGAIAGSGGGTAPSLDTMTGDGSDTTLTLSTSPVNENATFVTIDGVLQHKDTYSISGNTLTFSEAPPSGAKVESITLTTTSSTTANILSDADADTKVQVEESSDEDKIRFDTGGTERAVIDSTGLTVTGTINDLTVAAGNIETNTSNNLSINTPNSLRLNIDSNNSATDQVFVIGHNQTAVDTNNSLMTILESGNTGIGENNPDELLTVAGDIKIKSTNRLHFTNTSDQTSIHAPASNTMAFTTNSSERIRIDSSGNVLVGTTSFNNLSTESGVLASNNVVMARGSLADHQDACAVLQYASDATWLRAYGDTSGSGYMIFRAGGGAGATDVEYMRINSTGEVHITSGGSAISPTIKHSGGTGDVSKLRLINRSGQGADKGGLLELGGITDDGVSRSDVFASIAGLKDNATSGNKAGYMQFMTSNGSSLAEKMRLTSNGELLIGRTTQLQSDNMLTVEGSGTGAGNAIMDIRNTASSDTCGCIALSKASTTTDSSARFIWFFANNFSTSMGAIGGNGASNVQFVTASDERLKENIKPLTGSLDKVLALNPVSYTWKESGEDIKAGFVAQEVEKILPEYTATEEDEMKTKSLTGGMTAGYIAVLTKAIQEQQEQIDALKSEIQTLKGE